MGQHTIILIQPTHLRSSRTFMDYESVDAAMDGICGIFENRLKELSPNRRHITYDISELYQFIDSLGDLSALVLDHNMYAPCNKEWIKDKLTTHLKRQAGISNNRR